MKFKTSSFWKKFTTLALVIGPILVGCRPPGAKLSGHYTALSKNLRGPASINNEGIDSKQIYIYCQISTTHTKQCFQEQYNKLTKNLRQNRAVANIEVNNDELYEKSKKAVEEIDLQVLQGLSPKIEYFVNKQKTFCQMNAKLNPEKCLQLNIEANSMAILNHYQNIHPNINGHEYLYLKKAIQKEMQQKLALNQ